MNREVFESYMIKPNRARKKGNAHVLRSSGIESGFGPLVRLQLRVGTCLERMLRLVEEHFLQYGSWHS
jgi:hypothetical protein